MSSQRSPFAEPAPTTSGILPPSATHRAEEGELTLSVVVPVYRSEPTLPELCRRIAAALEASIDSFEILLVEDCGGDGSWAVIQSLAAKDPRVRGVRLSRNFGQHAATICGITQARGRWIATMDDDLEQAPESLPELFAKAQEGYDLVYGVYEQRTHQSWRNLTSELARWMFKTAIPSLNDAYTSFRCIRGDIARALSQFDSPFPFVDGYLCWLTNRYATVTVAHGARMHGTSNYTFSKLLTHTINIFVTFSDLPLRMASWIGMTFFGVGMVWLGVILVGRLTGLISISGFASIMAAIMLFGGIQMLILGVFGEYLGRMNFKSSRKPLFLMAEGTGAPLADKVLAR
jgi:polyisoprenyl-phosphate glycosyltransferase